MTQPIVKDQGIHVLDLGSDTFKLGNWTFDAQGRRVSDGFWMARDFRAGISFDDAERVITEWTKTWWHLKQTI